MLKPELPQLTPQETAICRHLLNYFTIEGKPGGEAATEGQIAIFHAIVFRPSKHIEIISTTQYGKSLFIALGCIIVSCIQGELVPVVAPKKEQAKKIMRYYIEHMADSPLFYTQLEKNTKLDRLRMEENKERIVLRNGGGVAAFSVEAGNSTKGVEAVMGEGGRIVIQDESALIPDEHEATIYRMLAGKGENTCYIKIGNPFYNNHFKTSWYDLDYYKVFIDCYRALKEGRYNQSFLDKALKKPLADILYLCQFPDEDEMDAKGFRKLFKSDEYGKMLLEEKPQLQPLKKKLGVDIARGGNWNAYVIRDKQNAYILQKDKARDLMATVGNIIKVVKEEKIEWEDVFVDDTGMGGGVVDRLAELDHYVNACQEGSKATGNNKERFINAKAESNFAVRDWVMQKGGRIYGKEFDEVQEIKWKVTSQGDGKIRMESKEEMRKRNIVSPDFWDALTLTFYDKSAARPSISSL
jgi:hypothetical protein